MKGNVKLKWVMGSILLIIGMVISIYYMHPRTYSNLVEQYAKEFNLDKNLIYAIIKVESNFNTNAISRRGAKGLMQIMDNTGAWGAEHVASSQYSHDKLFVPEINLKIGCWYIGKLLHQYNGNVDMALAAYNAGSGNVAKWRSDSKYSLDGQKLHTIPFKETKNYIKKVNWHYKLYEILYTH